MPRLLVVDDNPENRDILVRRLARAGSYRLEQAADGIEALAAIRAGVADGDPFDVMLLDVMMPRLNGMETLSALASDPVDDRPAVIMISAATELDTVVRCIELGAEDYLSKPFIPRLLSARLGNVLEKKQLRDQVARQLRRLESELAEARRQQLSMVPEHFPQPTPEFPFAIHAVMHPAREVGGDLYDYFEAAPGLLCIAVGDVSDKGMAAALFMARTRSLLRGAALQHATIMGEPPRPSQVAAVLNEELCKNNPAGMFVTLLVGFLRIETGEFLFVNAGHPRPLHIAADRPVVEAATLPEPPLGVLPELQNTDYVLTLERGDMLVIVTDGLADMMDPDGNSYSEARVASDLEALRSAPPDALCAALTANVRAFAGNAAAADDVTILALRRL